MKTLITLLFVLYVTNAFASEEENAILTSIEATTAEIPHFGSVTVSAKTDGGRIARLIINAFGKSHTVAGESLKRISEFPLSSMRITHEAGYQELGGYTVHVKFRRTYYNSEKKLRDETAIISVTEKKGLMEINIRDAK